MTQRRTTKLASRPISPDAPYCAVQCNQIAPGLDRVTCAALHDLRITDHRGANFVDIKEGEVYDLVRSGSLGDNLFYIVTEERCSCPATTPQCKHRRPMFKVEAQPETVEEQTSKGASTDTESAAQPASAPITTVPMRREDARGTLHNSAKPGFLDACFGTSKASAKYRDEYVNRMRGL